MIIPLVNYAVSRWLPISCQDWSQDSLYICIGHCSIQGIANKMFLFKILFHHITRLISGRWSGAYVHSFVRNETCHRTMYKPSRPPARWALSLLWWPPATCFVLYCISPSLYYLLDIKVLLLLLLKWGLQSCHAIPRSETPKSRAAKLMQHSQTPPVVIDLRIPFNDALGLPADG